MKIQLFLFIPSIVCLILAVLSVPLIYLPATELERKVWHILHIRIFRHWVTKKGTERWAQKGTIQNVVERSRKNIAYHGIITFTFCSFMARAQFVDNVFIQYTSTIFLVPSVAYFLGSLIQRQKLIIILIRRKTFKYWSFLPSFDRRGKWRDIPTYRTLIQLHAPVFWYRRLIFILYHWRGCRT